MKKSVENMPEIQQFNVFGLDKIYPGNNESYRLCEDISDILDSEELMKEFERTSGNLYDFKGLTDTIPELTVTSINSTDASNTEGLKVEKTRKVRPTSPRLRKTSPRKRTRNASTTNKNNEQAKWKSWSREEEVFLVGIVMERFFKRGSLSSTRGNDDCWSYIKEKYDAAWKKYEAQTGHKMPQDRSLNALSRHYKVMKARISQADVNGEEIDDFRDYFLEWQQDFNIGNCLIGKSRKRESNTGEFKQRKVRLACSTSNDITAAQNYRRDSVFSEGTDVSERSDFEQAGGYAIRQGSEVA